MRLEGKKALITGSSSGIGKGVAIAFAGEGADVVINYPGDEQRQDAEDVISAVTALGRQATAVRADVAVEEEVDGLVNEAQRHLGRIDILVNNAGIAHTAPLEEIPVDVWDRVLAVHLRGTFLVTRRVLPQMYE